MSAKKAINAEEEIERDYRKYKEEFEKWKEQNRGAMGTDAYNKYVRDFEEWEKDVEKRKAMARKKGDTERASENDEAAAKAYAQTHEQYLRIHQKGIAEDAMRSRLGGGFKTGMHASPLSSSSNLVKMDSENIASLMNSMQTAIASAIRSPADIKHTPSATISAPPVMKSQQPPAPVVQQPPIPKPVQLWWTRKPEYGPHDRLYKMFAARAAPTTTRQEISDSYDYYVPGWLVQREMANNQLVFPNQSHIPSLSSHPSTTEPPFQIPSLLTDDVPIPQDFSVPPPTFRAPLPPPAVQSLPQAPPPQHIPLFNPNVPPPPLLVNMSMPPPQIIQAGMKRTHSFPGRQIEPMHIPPQRG